MEAQFDPTLRYSPSFDLFAAASLPPIIAYAASLAAAFLDFLLLMMTPVPSGFFTPVSFVLALNMLLRRFSSLIFAAFVRFCARSNLPLPCGRTDAT